MKKNFKLCYVEGDSAWFTTKEDVTKQGGDDWNDTPYEHNAGSPYKPCWHREQGKCNCDTCKRDWNDDYTPKWEIKEVKFYGPFLEPNDGHYNSPYSVEMINAKQVPWLKTETWVKNQVEIWAGTSLEDFTKLVKKAGGKVLLKF